MTTGRYEDRRLLTGGGLYVGDAMAPGLGVAGFLRADVASARIDRIDVSAARALPGVLGVFTGRDLAADGIGPIGHDPLPRDDGGRAEMFAMPILALDTIRHAGEPLALVVAETRGALLDAIEAIAVETTDMSPPAGTCFCKDLGDAAATDAAFAAAAHTAEVTIDVPRATVAAMEPRGLIVRHMADGLQLRASTQNPFALRDQLAAHPGLDPGAIHVQAQDVGGSFGLKGALMREDVALVWAARRLGVDLGWMSTRSEALMADAQGRAVTGRVALAFDDELRLLAIRGDFAVDAGAWPSHRAMGLIGNMTGLTGMYAVPTMAARVTGTLSARPPLAPLRGSGRPEATYAIERAMDAAARTLGIDPVELRRRNLIPASAMPTVTGLGVQIDCGDFARVMDAALALAGDATARRADARARGVLHGVGLANCIEAAAGPVRRPRPDFARITVEAGRITLAPGVMSVGQGHETAMARLLADRLEIAPGDITYVNGDTQALSQGRGSGGSAGISVAGSAVVRAAEALLDEGRAAAAAGLGCAADEITFRDGAFHRAGSNESLSLADIARAKGGRWQVEATFAPAAASFPNGTHICEVEIDPETGLTRVTRYAAVEDVGRVLNPTLVEGQMHGGIAMGLSFGLGEQIVHDADGQLLTGSFMDYRMIRAADLPGFALERVEVPTGLNPLGTKGVGEAGTVGSTAALASAVADALAQAGVTDFELPATPCRVWQALQRARR